MNQSTVHSGGVSRGRLCGCRCGCWRWWQVTGHRGQLTSGILLFEMNLVQADNSFRETENLECKTSKHHQTAKEPIFTLNIYFCC